MRLPLFNYLVAVLIFMHVNKCWSALVTSGHVLLEHEPALDGHSVARFESEIVVSQSIIQFVRTPLARWHLNVLLMMVENAVLVKEEIHQIQHKSNQSKSTGFINKIETKHQETFVRILLESGRFCFLFLFLFFNLS